MGQGRGEEKSSFVFCVNVKRDSNVKKKKLTYVAHSTMQRCCHHKAGQSSFLLSLSRCLGIERQHRSSHLQKKRAHTHIGIDEALNTCGLLPYLVTQ